MYFFFKYKQQILTNPREKKYDKKENDKNKMNSNIVFFCCQIANSSAAYLWKIAT